MKLKTLRPLLCVAVLLPLHGPRGFCETARVGAFVQPGAAPAAPDIAGLQTARQAALESVAAERAKWMSALDAWCLSGVDKILAERTQAGDLDGVVALQGGAGTHRRACGPDPGAAGQLAGSAVCL